jgi:tetratricopeptide (TPR) repeat protein
MLPVLIPQRPEWEEIMRKTSLLATAMLAAIAFGYHGFASAMESSSPAAPAPSQQTTPPSNTKAKTSKKPKQQKNSALDGFLTGYRAAYALIYDKGDYTGGIAALRALGYDNNPDVATLIGYASRKLGRYDDARYWYDKALAADPNHVLTWSYYGMWQAEQGNVLKARDDLEKVQAICGNTDCVEYKALKAAIDGTVTY